MEKIEHNRKASFFKTMKFLYDYKITLLISLLWFCIYYLFSMFWGLFNNLTFLNIIIKNPLSYLGIPIVLFLTHIVKYGTDTLDKLCYGKKASETEKLFDSEETFHLWREQFYNRIFNNKVIIPIIFVICLIVIGIPIPYFIFIIEKGNLYNVANIYDSPILLIANIVNLGYLFLFTFGSFLGAAQLIICIITISKIPKEKLSINQLVKKYQSRLHGNNVEVETITYIEFRNYNRAIGKFIFKLFLKLIILDLFINIVCIIPVQLGILTIESYISLTFYSILIGFIIISFFIITQHSIHKILKKSKQVLIDVLNTLQEKLSEKMGDELYSDVKITQDFKDGLKKLEYITTRKMEIKKLGTWPYDFPEVLKLIGLASLNFAPIIIAFLPIV